MQNIFIVPAMQNLYTGFVHFFRPKIQGLFQDFLGPYLEISRTFFNDNFTSKPRKMFLLTSMFSWPFHCLEDCLRILRASCLSYGSARPTFPLHLGRCSYCQQNKTVCLNSCHLFEARTYRHLFPAIFIKMTPSWHCDIQLTRITENECLETRANQTCAVHL